MDELFFPSGMYGNHIYRKPLEGINEAHGESVYGFH